MKTARLLTVTAFCVLLCAACGGPSVRYKKDVSQLLNAQNYSGLEAKIKENKSKMYGVHNQLLYYLDLSSPLTDSYQYQQVNQTLSAAQDTIEELQIKSVTQAMGTLIINDNTMPYRAPIFEQSLTYFYRAMAFLSDNDKISAAVEARKAVYFLDTMRAAKHKGYNDDPFVQYFASMIFEDIGQMSDARIARTNAQNAYDKYKSWLNAKAPAFELPPNYKELGEAVVLHYNGKVPYKISNNVIFAWNDIWFALDNNSQLDEINPQIINAVYAGAFGKSITIAFPSLVENSFKIRSSHVTADGIVSANTQLVADIAQTAKITLDEQKAATYTRTIVRAVTKYILSIQARNTAAAIANNDTVGDIVGHIFSILSTVTETADTRSWFTLPAQIRMASLFLAPGEHTIKLICTDDSGTAIDEHLFENVQIKEGQRTYLYYRTAK